MIILTKREKMLAFELKDHLSFFEGLQSEPKDEFSIPILFVHDFLNFKVSV